MSCWAKTGAIAANKTEIATHQRMLGQDAFERTVTAGPLHIIDFGPGDGVFLAGLLERLSRTQRRTVEVKLIDKRQTCLTASVARLRTHFPETPIVSMLADIADAMLFPRLRSTAPCVAVFLSILHEFPHANRYALLRKAVARFEYTLVSEIEGDHDLSDETSIAYRRSVLTFYRAAYDEIYSGGNLTEAERHAAWTALLEPELFRLLNGAWPDRDRHYRLPDFLTAVKAFPGVSPTPFEWRSRQGLRAFAVLLNRSTVEARVSGIAREGVSG